MKTKIFSASTMSDEGYQGFGKLLAEKSATKSPLPRIVEIEKEDTPRVQLLKHMLLDMTAFQSNDRPDITDVEIAIKGIVSA